MTLLGGISLDSMYNHSAAHDGASKTEWSVLSRGAVLQGPEIEPAVSGLSRYGQKYATLVGGESSQVFEAPTAGAKVWIYWPVRPHTEDGTVGKNGCLYTDNVAVGSAVSPPTAETIRVYRSKNTTTSQYGWAIDEYTGGAWSNIFVEALSSNTYSSSTIHFMTLEVDLTAKTVDLWVDGTKITAANSTTNTPNVTSPVFFNEAISGGKGGGGVDVMGCFELLMNDDDNADGLNQNTRYTYASAGAGTHVMALYAILDNNTLWTPTNTCDGSRWRAVADPEMAVPEGENYIGITGDGTNQDQAFGMEDGDVGATIRGLMLAAGTDVVGEKVDALFLDDGVRDVKTGRAVGSNLWRIAMFAADPSGNPWTLPNWNAIIAGVRNSSASTAEKCHILIANVIGDGLTRRGGNALYADCVTTFRRRGQVF